jgi:hypothetical protein
MLGAGAGLVGVCAPGGREFEVSLLDPGDLALDPAEGFRAAPT